MALIPQPDKSPKRDQGEQFQEAVKKQQEIAAAAAKVAEALKKAPPGQGAQQ